MIRPAQVWLATNKDIFKCPKITEVTPLALQTVGIGTAGNMSFQTTAENSQRRSCGVFCNEYFART